MFCLHIMNILDYLKPDKFPNKYILKRYTKTAKSQPTFDTRDYNTTASDGSSRLSKQDILLQLNLMVNKKAMRCDQQYDRAYYVLKRLVEELDAIHSANRADADQMMAEEDAELKMTFIIMQLKCSTPPLKPTNASRVMANQWSSDRKRR